MGLFKQKKHYSFDVVGLPYYREAQDKVGRLDKNTLIEILPEPDNEYDKNAIKVVVNGQKIGHVPARQCKLVKGVLNLGTMYDKRIEISRTDKEWVSARVTMYYKQ